MREPRIEIAEPGAAARLAYTYTDGTNHKFSSSVVLEGRITAHQAAMLTAKLAPGGEFVPRDVGMPMLQLVANSFWHASDHAWHTLDVIETTTDAPTGDVDLATMLERWSAVGDWDDEAAEDALAEDLGPENDEDDEGGEDAPSSPMPGA